MAEQECGTEILPSCQRTDWRSVGVVVTGLLREVPGLSMLVHDDGSTDGTRAAATAACAAVLTLPYNLGGVAMRATFKYALADGYDAAVQVDADGQHDPACAAALRAKFDTTDMVSGARFAGPVFICRWPQDELGNAAPAIGRAAT